MNEPSPPTSEEKLLSALAHVFGPLAAVIVWATQKDKSRFIKFQALQALSFDLVVTFAASIIIFCSFGVAVPGMFVYMFQIMENAATANDFMMIVFFPFIFSFSITACFAPFSMIVMMLRVFAGISILNGRNYKYPLVGKWVENFLK